MASTYDVIASYTLTSPATSYTFSSIPTTYTDLVLILSGTATGGSSVLLQVGNGSIDTGTNYSRTGMQGNGSAASSYRGSNESQITVNWFTTAQGNATFHFKSYANTSTYKTILHSGGWSDVSTHAAVGLWRSTSAINTIKIGSYSYNMNAGTTITIYGIKAA